MDVSENLVFSDFPLGVAVVFAPFADGLEENGAFEVCILLTGATEIDVAVILAAQEDDQLPQSARANGTLT